MAVGDDPRDNSQPTGEPGEPVIVGHFRILERIGSGGMADVYLAEDTRLNRKAVLKFLAKHQAADAEVRARFTREAQAVAKLNHQNVLTIYEIGEEQGRPYFATEHVDGVSLRNTIRAGNISVRRAIEFGIQLAAGLQAAHAAGVVHRDIKPTNIIVDRNGICKLLDFGLATIQGYEQVSRDGTILGTVGYMSPEQVRGERADSRSDLFSLGIVLFEMVTGKNPFRREYEAATILAIAHEAAPRLEEYVADIPSRLQQAVDKALEKNTGSRYQTAAELIGDLRAVAAELDGIESGADFASGRVKPSIAVLPFANLSADRRQDYFCDGMAEEIINSLSRVEGLRVVARTSAFSFRGKEQDIREIGRKLNVATVLEGSVRMAGNRLRIAAQLINVTDGYHLWSEKYDRTMEDIFSIQDEIALAIVDCLKVKLLKQEKTLLTRRHTENREAYNLYLKGRYFWNRRFEGGLQKAVECFQQAIAQDPRFAPAYVGIADAHNVLGHLYLSPVECYDVSQKAVKTALGIDNSLAEAHAALGFINTFHLWDFEAAEREFEQAVELNPNYSDLREFYALFLGIMGRYDEGFAQVRKGLQLDPVSLILNAVLGLAFYWGRRYEEALEQIQRTLELERDFFLAHLFKGFTLSAMRRWEEAISAFDQLASLSPENPLVLGHLGMTYGLSGRQGEAESVLGHLGDLAGCRYVAPMYLALVCAGLGRWDESFKLFDEACVKRDSWMPALLHAPFADCLRPDPRFSILLKRIGFKKQTDGSSGMV